MKRLNLLKPNEKTGYLNGGRGQEVNYIELTDDLNLKSLEQDVKNGAKQFAELLEFAQKKPSRFVVIDANNKEDGLMAASYLAGIYNIYDKVDGYIEGEQDGLFDFIPMSYDEYDEDAYDFDEDGEDDWEEEDSWEEHPWKMPVVYMNQLSSSFNSFNPVFDGPFGFGSSGRSKDRQPYWNYTRHEPICIISDGNSFCGNYTNMLRRYSKNRHVYIVNIKENREFESDLTTEEGCEEYDNQMLCEVILEYAAGTVKVSCTKEDRRSYFVTLFVNWVATLGCKLTRNFPKVRICHKIVSMRNTEKSALMEKVLNYVIKDADGKTVLEEKDFDILDRFKSLGMESEEGGHKSTKKLEEQLVGMDNVKEQIYGIVEIMKYNKRRKEMGLGNGNYHNVHMLLGAPGTAKTTMAQFLGNIMAEEHLLGDNRFIAVNGAELKGMYVGHSAPKVKALFDAHDIILIDEAYSIAAQGTDSMDSFSQEAIAQLIIELEKHGMDRLVFFAGYGGKNVTEKDNKMKDFLQANPGIRSRINSTIFFDSYTPEQMVEIFHCHVRMNKYIVDSSADNVIRDYFAKRSKDKDFGNGREARSLLENAVMEAAKRLAKVPEEKLTKKMLQELTAEDIEKAIHKVEVGHMTQRGQESVTCGFAV